MVVVGFGAIRMRQCLYLLKGDQIMAQLVRTKKVIASLLSAAMLMSSVPSSVLGSELPAYEPDTQAVTVADGVEMETVETAPSMDIEVSDPGGTGEVDISNGESMAVEDVSVSDTGVADGGIVMDDVTSEGLVPSEEGQLAAQMKDFSSQRILVVADDASLIEDAQHIIGEADGLYLMQYDSAQDAADAYGYYYGRAAAVDTDTLFRADSPITPESMWGVDFDEIDFSQALNADVNPFKFLAAEDGLGVVFDNTIAVIGTGCASTDADSAVSVIGSVPLDNNGQGASMVAAVRGMAPEAGVFSVKAFNSNGYSSVSSVVAAIRCAVKAGAKTIVLAGVPVGTSANDILDREIKAASKDGVLVIAGALIGTTASDDYISVASCDITGQPAAVYEDGAIDYYAVADDNGVAAAKVAAGLFGSGQDGTLTVNAEKGVIFDANGNDLGTAQADEDITVEGEPEEDGIVIDGEDEAIEVETEEEVSVETEASEDDGIVIEGETESAATVEDAEAEETGSEEGVEVETEEEIQLEEAETESSEDVEDVDVMTVISEIESEEETEAVEAEEAVSEVEEAEEMEEVEAVETEAPELPEGMVPVNETVETVQTVPEDYVPSDAAIEAAAGEDFSSMKLLVKDDGDAIMEDAVSGNYEDMYVMDYDSMDAAREAFMYYYDEASAVEADGFVSVAASLDAEGVEVADDQAEETVVTSGDSVEVIEAGYVPSEEDVAEEIETAGTDALSVLSEIADEPSVAENLDNVIALIDTGVSAHPNVIDRVSVIGDEVNDEHGHGTKMLSLMTQLNPDVRILSVKAMDASGYGSMSAIYAGVKNAIEKNVKIIVLPLSARKTETTFALKEAIDEALAAGIIVVGAAGNNGKDAVDYIPGGLDDIYVIGACDDTGVRVSLSNFGDTVDYYVVADYTSEAAVRFAAALAAAGFDPAALELNNGLIYTPDYEPAEIVVEEETEEDYGDDESWESEIESIDFLGSFNLSGLEGFNNIFVNDENCRMHIDGDFMRPGEEVRLTITPDAGMEFFDARALQVNDGLLMDGITNEPTFADAAEFYMGTPERNLDGSVSFTFVMPNSPLWINAACGRPDEFHVALNGLEILKSYGNHKTKLTSQHDTSGDWGSNTGATCSVAFTDNTGSYGLTAHKRAQIIYKIFNQMGDEIVMMEEYEVYCLESSRGAPFRSIKNVVNFDNYHNQSKWYDRLIKALYLFSKAPIKSTVLSDDTEEDFEDSILDDGDDTEGAGMWGHKFTDEQGHQTDLKALFKNNKIKMTKKSVYAAKHYYISYLYWNAAGKPSGWYWTAGSGTNKNKVADMPNHLQKLFKAMNTQLDAFALPHAAFVYKDNTGTTIRDVGAYFTEDQVKEEGNYYVTPWIKYYSYVENTLTFAVPVGTGVQIYGSNTIYWGERAVSIAGYQSFRLVGNPAYVTQRGSEDYTPYRGVGKYFTTGAATGITPKNNKKGQIVGCGMVTNAAPLTVYVEWPSTVPVKVLKSSSIPEITNGNGNYKLGGATIVLTSVNNGKKYTFTTKADGSTDVQEIPRGAYIVEETVAPAGFTKFEPFVYTVTGNYNPDPEPINVADPPIYAVTQWSALFAKVGTNSYVGLDGAEFDVHFDASGDASRDWKFVSKSFDLDGSGVIDNRPGQVESGLVYINEDCKTSGTLFKVGDVAIVPLGKLTIKETKAPRGYVVNSKTAEVTVSQSGENAVVTWTKAPNEFRFTQTQNGGKYSNYDDNYYNIDIQIHKADFDKSAREGEGDVDLSGITFEVYRADASYESEPSQGTYDEPDYSNRRYFPGDLVATIVTETPEGYGRTYHKALQIGFTYVLKEVKSKDGYHLTDGEPRVITVAKDLEKIPKNHGKVLDALSGDPKDDWRNKVWRDGLTVKKLSEPTMTDTPEGDADLSGIQFAVVNRSMLSVKIGDRIFEKGQIVKILTTDAKGFCEIANDVLPYGTYEVIELRSDHSLKVGNVYDSSTSKYGTSIYANKNRSYRWGPYHETKELHGNGATYSYGTQNPPTLGGVHLRKVDYDTKKDKAQGDAILSGIDFAIVNRSKEATKVEGVSYAPGQIVKIITTDTKGEAKTTNETLPYGTYEVIELRADHSYRAGDVYDVSGSKTGKSIYANKAGNTAATDSNHSSMLFDSMKETITIRYHHEMVGDGVRSKADGSGEETFNDKRLRFENHVVRGGLHLYKDDYDRKFNAKAKNYIPQGDAVLSGIDFAIVNRSEDEVMVEGVLYGKGKVVKVITTDEKGEAWTTNETLPYGTYEVIELRADNTIKAGDEYDTATAKYGKSEYANDAGHTKADDSKHSSMLFDAMRETITIRYNHEMVGDGERDKVDGSGKETFTDNRLRFSNHVVRGGLHLYKDDYDRKFNAKAKNFVAQGDTTLKGIKFAIVNRSQEDVWVDGAMQASGKVVKIIVTDEKGEAWTTNETLPYGTYDVIELRDDATVAVGDVYDNVTSKYGKSIYANHAGNSAVDGANTSSMLFDEMFETIIIRYNHEMVGMGTRDKVDGSGEEKFDDNRLQFENHVVRGGLHLYKDDYDRKFNAKAKNFIPQGDATLEGIDFAIVNRSKEDVWVDGAMQAPGKVVKIITTDVKGEAWTTNETLPYGTYDVIELRADHTIKVGDDYDASSDKYGISIYANRIGYEGVNNREYSSMLFDAMRERITIRYHHEMVGDGVRSKVDGSGEETFDDNRLQFENHVARGGVHLYKADEESKNFTDPVTDEFYDGYTAQGDATLMDIRFAVVNRGREDVWILKDINVSNENSNMSGTQSGLLAKKGIYEPGKVVAILNTNRKGEAWSDATLLPYGTYEIIEQRADSTIAIGDVYDDSSAKYGTSIYANTHGNYDVHNDENLQNIINKYTYVERSQAHADMYRYLYKVGEICSEEEWQSYSAEQMMAVLLTSPQITESEREFMVGITYKSTTKYGSMLYAANKETFEIRNEGEIAGEKKSDDLAPNDGKERIHYVNRVVRGGFELYKLDKETMISYALGGARLSGIEFTLYNKSIWEVFVKNAKYPDGHMYKRGEVIDAPDGNSVWVTDDHGFIGCDNQYLPYGTYEIMETDTNETYMMSDTSSRVFEIREEGVIVGENEDHIIKTKEEALGQQLTVLDQVVRADFRFRKKDEMGRQMSNIPWVITNVVTGETHYIITDANGEYDSRTDAGDEHQDSDGIDTHSYRYAPHTRNTNAYDEVLAEYDKSGEQIPQSVIDDLVNTYHYNVGTWFGLSQDVLEGGNDGKGTMADPDDTLGAFPYGYFTIRELRCDANKDHTLVDDEFSVYRMDYLVDFGTIDDEPIDIRTKAFDITGGADRSQSGRMSDNARLIDEVEYTGVDTAKNYKLVTELRAVYGDGNETPYTLSPHVMKDGNGKELRFETTLWDEGEIHKRSFTRDVYITFNSLTMTDGSEEFEGGKTVVCEYLYEVTEDGEEILRAIHARPDAESQWIDWPYIKTTLVDKQTDLHIGLAREDMELVDHVYYKNLRPYQKYTFVGTLMDKETGEPVLDEDGNEITATTEKLIRTSEGYVDVVFKFNGVPLAGKSVVAFEDVDGGYLVHADINDEDQTVQIPKIGTKAKDLDTDDEVGKVVGSIVDTVTYENLIPGYTYRMSGAVYDRTTGKVTDITASAEFTPTEKDGEMEMTFVLSDTLSKEDVEGKTFVIFEECTLLKEQEDGKPEEDTVIAEHKDPDDKGQSVYMPKIRTTAVDGQTLDHVGTNGEKVVIIDTVDYTNLVPGKEYKMVGSLHLHGTGEDLNCTAETVFTPEQANGQIELKFELDGASLEGKTVVVYEKLFHNTVEVTQHEDPKDEAQSVDYPEVFTTAVDSATNGHVGTTAATATVYDDVVCKNLNVGQEYTINGTLRYKEDCTDSKGVEHKAGDVVMDGDKEVAASATFTAEKKDETHRLTFTFNSELLEGQSLVAFEDLEHKKIKVATHSDLEDEDQTVNFPKIRTLAIDGKTADHVGTDADTTVIDTVKYENFVVGETYRLVGTLMDKQTGEPVVIDGKEVTADTGAFTAQTKNGEVKLTFNVDAKDLGGHTVVVFEKLFAPVKDDDGKDTEEETVVDTHEDINDEDQSVHYPEVETTAKDSLTADHVGTNSAETTLVDTVAVKNLIPGQEYTITGTLMAKDGEHAGQTLLDKDGKVVTASKTFTAEKADEEHELVFTVDASALRGQTVVAFEKLFHKNPETETDVEVAHHEDIDDEDQSVHYPWMKTLAVDSRTGDHVGSIVGTLINAFRKLTGEEIADSDFAGIIDTIEYKNLVPEMEYRFEGVLMNREEGTVITDEEGNPVTGSAVLEAGHPADGTIDVLFDVDTSKLTNVIVVCFEKMYHKNPETEEDVEVDRHEDLTDEAQSVYEIEIDTTALDMTTRSHTGYAAGDTVIDDEVSLKNVVSGQEYTVVGTLHDAATGEAVTDADGKPYETRVTFVAGVDDVFELTGETVEAPEAKDVLYIKNLPAGNIVTLGGQTFIVAADGTIIVVGFEYGTYDASANAPGANAEDAQTAQIVFEEGHNTYDWLSGEYSNTEIAASTDAKASLRLDGIVHVKFAVSGKAFEGKDIVVYQDVFHKDVRITTHSDAQNANQTVKYPKIRTTAVDSLTGTHEGQAGKTVLYDDVKYENLVPGRTYMMTGQAHIKTDGSAIGEKVSVEFVPEEANGVVRVEIPVDTAALAGTTVVAFEELFEQDIEIAVAVHEDIEDEDQSVNIVDISTTLEDADTQAHETQASAETVLVDHVAYIGLTPGKEYTMRGELMDKESGESTGVKAEATFVPETADGFVDLTFTIDTAEMAGKALVAFERLYDGDVKIAVHEDIEDEDQTVNVIDIRTRATDKITGGHEAQVSKDGKVVDTVTYTGLTPGVEYVMSGTLMNKETGEAVTDAVQVKFTPDAPDGIVEIEFTVDTSKMAGKSLVAFEKLARADKPETVIAKHEDLTDEEQTVNVIDIRTHATDHITGGHEAEASADGQIVDTVTYTGLTPGVEYIMSGTLMNKATGKAVTDAVQVKFTPEKPDGSVEISFKIDTSKMGGQSLVAFEKLARADKPETIIAEHEDLTDEEQTVTIVEIRTHATNHITGGHEIDAVKDGEIVDTVTYKGLTPGVEYIMSGTLMDKETGKAITDAVQVKFTPEKADGSVEIKFTVDTSEMAGKAVVAFEKLARADKPETIIARHEDLNDEDQTVNVVKITTVLTDVTTKSHEGRAVKEAELTDSVTYTGLMPGKKYIVKGELMKKSDGSSTGVTASAEFTPEKADGSVDLVFKIDTSKLAGDALVAFERLYSEEKPDVPVAVHEDINDTEQTVAIVEITTELKDKESGKHETTADEKDTLIDTVTYKGLVPGAKYTVKGELMDKETGKGTGIKAEKTFTAKEANGTVDLTFTGDTSKMEGKSLVAFEKLYNSDDVEIASHEDINDEKQTVKVNTPVKKPEEKKTANIDTGDTGLPFMVFGGFGLIFLLAALVYIWRRRRMA